MFVAFFHELKSAGLAVTLREYLTLMEAVEADLASRQCDRICGKIAWTDRVPPAGTVAVLCDFHAAQRRYLEREQLFGRPRADKFQGAGFKGSGEPGSRA